MNQRRQTEIKAFIVTVKLSLFFKKSLKEVINKSTIWETLTPLSQKLTEMTREKNWQGYRRLEQHYQPP